MIDWETDCSLGAILARINMRILVNRALYGKKYSDLFIQHFGGAK